jgi:hypothetical protein
METSGMAETGKSFPFEQFLARYAEETDRRIKEFYELQTERQREADERQREAAERFKELQSAMEETERVVKEVAEEQKKTDRQMKETDKKISKLGGRFGEAIEYMVMPNLVHKFRELGFVFTKAYRGATIEDERNQIAAEIDITLENGDKVMIVEVKSKPNAQDVKDHIKRMEKVRRHADMHGDRRIFLGAVAGLVMNDEMRKFVLQNGFYVIEPSGDTFDITVPKGEYNPREW